MKKFTCYGLWFVLSVFCCIVKAQQPEKAIKPGDDFYACINSKWIESNKIPDDMPAWGGFQTLGLENQQKLKGILEQLSANAHLPAGTAEQKIGDFYASGMDTATINKLGFTPLLPVFKSIDAIKNYHDLLFFIARLYREGQGYLLGFSVEPDQKNSNINIVSFSQAGTVLPEKSYYTRTDAQSVMIRSKYEDYVASMFTLTGDNALIAKKKAAAVLALETRLAMSHLSNVELRDPAASYHKMTIAEFQKITPHIQWDEILRIMGVQTNEVDVAHPQYFKTLDSMLVALPIATWKDKLKYTYININSSLLSKSFQDSTFAFSQLFTGLAVQPERWKTMVGMSDGELLGQLYVKQYFTPRAKAKIDTLVTNLLISFKTHLENLTWMSETTKKEALLKLSKISRKIGYPDKIKNYDKLSINRTDFFGNAQHYALFTYEESLKKINKPVDKSEWAMTAPTVNAYYNPLYNEIVFPAGILQPPFFDADADDATNYGGIGMVISHEITHGFDDQGRQYDASGNLRDWWTKEDAERFSALSHKLVNQYNNYKVLDTTRVNGQLTLGENIADLGGIAIAYDAFKLTKQGKSNKVVNGISADQEFFNSFGTIWRFKARDNYVAMLINVDVHSPAQFRVNGPLSNFEPFYQAYQLTGADKMYKKPEDRITIW
jgi:putative endopeptidase